MNKSNLLLNITLMKKHQTGFTPLPVWKNQYKCYLFKKKQFICEQDKIELLYNLKLLETYATYKYLKMLQWNSV